MTGRGGKRANAGRKKVLTDGEMIALGGECERRWREAVEGSSLAAKRKAYPNIYQYYDEIRDADLQTRQERAKKGTYAREDMTERKTEAVKNDLGLADDEITYDEDENPIVPGVLPGREVRAYAVLPGIYEALAREETARRGIVITPRRVRECLKKFREFQKEISG